jgi:hypothetical protein
MDILQTIKQSWRMIWRSPSLWLLSLVRQLTGGILAALTAIFLVVGIFSLLPRAALRWRLPYQLAWLRTWIAHGGWAALLLLWLLLACGLGLLMYLLLAAQLRRADHLASDPPPGFGQSLALGWRRLGYFTFVFLVNLAFSLLMVGLVAVLVLGGASAFILASMLFLLAVVVLSLLSVPLQYLLLPLALDDLAPAPLLRRAWRVFAHGWWAFLLIYVILTQLPSVVITPMSIGLILLMLMTFALDSAWLLGAFLVLCLPCIFAIMWFTDVFILALSARVYRQVQVEVG